MACDTPNCDEIYDCLFCMSSSSLLDNTLPRSLSHHSAMHPKTVCPSQPKHRKGGRDTSPSHAENAPITTEQHEIGSKVRIATYVNNRFGSRTIATRARYKCPPVCLLCLRTLGPRHFALVSFPISACIPLLPLSLGSLSLLLLRDGRQVALSPSRDGIRPIQRNPGSLSM